MTRLWLAGLALVLAGTTVACSGGEPDPTPSSAPAATSTGTASPASTPPPTPTPAPTSQAAPDFVVATYDSSRTNGGMEALLLGTGVLRNGCFFLRPDDPDPDGAGLVLPVFPDQRVRIEGSRTYFNDVQLREGERIELGGGYVRSSQGDDRPRGCRGERTVFLVGDY